jgi:hypothetical protein
LQKKFDGVGIMVEQVAMHGGREEEMQEVGLSRIKSGRLIRRLPFSFFLSPPSSLSYGRTRALTWTPESMPDPWVEFEGASSLSSFK